MRRRAHNGFTLIELLIVIAIIAIVTAGSLAVLTAPAEENIFANADCDAEAGFGLCVASLVNDAHSATTATVAGNALIFSNADDPSRSSAYFTDSRRQIRRAVVKAGFSPGAAPGVHDQLGQAMITLPCTIDTEVSTASVSLTIGLEQKQLFRDKLDTRTLTLMIGNPGRSI